jgi:hypothetical protein
MIDIVPALVAGAIVGGLVVALPDLVADLWRAFGLRRAERSVVRGAEDLLRAGGPREA